MIDNVYGHISNKFREQQIQKLRGSEKIVPFTLMITDQEKIDEFAKKMTVERPADLLNRLRISGG